MPPPRAARRKSALHAAIRLYGAEAFTVETLSVHDSEEEALRAEREWIERLGAIGAAGYNMREGGRSAVGYRPTEATRRNMSAAQIARHALRPMSAETRSKISAAAKGRRPNAEVRAKMSESHRRRLAADPEAASALRERAREAGTHRTYGPATDDTRAKMREAHVKYWAENPPTKEFRAVISERNRRRGPLTDETKARISASAKAAWARRKKDE